MEEQVNWKLLKKNSFLHVHNAIDYFSSFEKQLQYEITLPYVDVISELLAQWEGAFSRKKNQIWFREIFDDMEWQKLENFDFNLYKKISRLNNKQKKLTFYRNTIEGQEIVDLALELLELLDPILKSLRRDS